MIDVLVIKKQYGKKEGSGSSRALKNKRQTSDAAQKNGSRPQLQGAVASDRLTPVSISVATTIIVTIATCPAWFAFYSFRSISVVVHR